MITRFDHAVIAVRDLEAATQQYQKLGFEVRPGGKHTGRGTYNSIIRFGLDYIELISIYDRDELSAPN
jgi:catechol 2,3-dioxygenase-like lactoylglutathione lyase family enzyme